MHTKNCNFACKSTHGENMSKIISPCDFVFSVSWEVCNKVGGIYTVLSTQARCMQKYLPDRIIYMGPDLGQGEENSDFAQDDNLLREYRELASLSDLPIRIGRWNIPGKPIAILVNSANLRSQRNELYGQMWQDFRVDSLHAYGDYDDACLFSCAAGKLACLAYKHIIQTGRVVFHAHEWMSGMGMLYVKKHCPEIATVFTTHATSIGRSIVCNGKPLYDYFNGYFGDQMARELNMEAKHSIEKQSAHYADCFTTVSELTNRECKQLLEKSCDEILPNGFDSAFVPSGVVFNSKRKRSRDRMLAIANALTGKIFPQDTIIISTSGRNDFRCKGYELFIDTMAKLQQEEPEKDILAVIAVPCWKKSPRQDLQYRLQDASFPYSTALERPIITHELHNWDSDQILCAIRNSGIKFDAQKKLHLLFVPTYLDGNDGIMNLTYYDWLTGCDLCVYPSYYEPWGYTPLESVAFGIPCITTNLAGFGIWAEEQLGHTATLADGIVLIKRTDSNHNEAINAASDIIKAFCRLTNEERKQISARCKMLAARASWKIFIKHYFTAYQKAIQQHNNK